MQSSITTGHILFVSRDEAVVEQLRRAAEAAGRHVVVNESGWDALERVQLGKAPELVLLDIPHDDADSLHTLRWLRRIRPDLPVVLLSPSTDEQKKNDALRLGAREYLLKPVPEDGLHSLIRSYLTPGEIHDGLESEEARVDSLGDHRVFVAASPAMRKLRAQAELLAQVNVPVLVVGEKGSGKETISRLLHKLSVRSGFHFVKVDCAALPGDLLEAELFGHSDDEFLPRPGKLELCARGTIFLNDIDEMPLDLQARLFRLIQEQSADRLATGRGAETDVRIIAAVNGKIEQVMAQHKLREDLYYQLSAFTIHVPSLRQRKPEVSLLLGHLMKHTAKRYGLPTRVFSSRLLSRCQAYDWPGNFEELENFVKRYLVTGAEDLALGESEYPFRGFELGRAPEVSELPSHDGRSGGPGLRTLVENVKGETERSAIAGALESTNWNRKAAARLLRVSYRTLLYKIQHYHMTPPQTQVAAPFGNPGMKGNGHGT